MHTRPEIALSEKLRSILGDINRLRPMPTSVSKVLNKLNEPHVSARTISNAIAMDQVLTSQILKMANSALLGYGPPSSSIHDAVMRVGFNRIRTLVLGAANVGPLSQRLSGYRMAPGELWHHALAVAVAAQCIAKRIQYSDPEEAYVAGLLHDMGKLILDQYMLHDYQKVVKHVREHEMQLWQVEEKLFGADHGTVGSWMAVKWNFPVSLIDAIQFHHAPSFARAHPKIAAIVNIANALMTEASDSQNNFPGDQVHPEALSILRMDESVLDWIQEEAMDNLERLINTTEYNIKNANN